MNKPNPTRQAFHTVCEACRRHGYRLAVVNGRAWLIKGLKWRSLRTEDVAAYISTLEPRNAPSVAENVPSKPAMSAGVIPAGVKVGDSDDPMVCKFELKNPESKENVCH